MVLFLFVGALFFCVLLDLSVIPALILGYILFFLYGLGRGLRPAKLLSLSWEGLWSIRSVLITYTLVGCLTALWRVSGTIPLIICAAVKLISPAAFLLISFLLCALMSTLTGTFLGAVTTLGVICMMLGRSLGIDPILLSGAILSGCRVGDRCSPLSTSALLVATVTKTDIYHNIKNMVRTCAIPFLVTCAVYFTLGRSISISAVPASDITGLLQENFSLSPAAAIPAALILLLSFFRLRVQYSMAISSLAAVAIALFLEGAAPAELLHCMVLGFHPGDEALSKVLSGGGISSMVNILLILLITSTYSRIFEATGLLDGVEHRIIALSRRITPYGALLLTSIAAAIITCGQSLTIILTCQLCQPLYPSRARLAAALEDTAAIIPALIPWSVACAVPLAALDAPLSGILAACYIYLLPLWHVFSQCFVEEESSPVK